DRDADAALAEATEGAHRHPQGGALAVGQLQRGGLPGEALAPLTRDWTLGIRPAWPAQTRSFRAVLKGDSW
ncbi:hypothetical protein R0G64_32245, partial [Pseudomonas otitidis]